MQYSELSTAMEGSNKEDGDLNLDNWEVFLEEESMGLNISGRKSSYKHGGNTGVRPEAGSVLDKTKAVLYTKSFPRGKHSACSGTNSVVKCRVKTHKKCLYLIFLTIKNLYLYVCFIYGYMYNGFIYDIYI